MKKENQNSNLRIYDPLSLNHLKLTKIFWSSGPEKAIRILGIITHILQVALSLVLFYYIFSDFAKESKTINTYWTNLWIYIMLGTGLVLLIFSLIYILPLIFARSASTLLSVSVIFIVFGILSLILFSGVSVGAIIYLKILMISDPKKIIPEFTKLMLYFSFGFYLFVFVVDLFVACYLINKVDKTRKMITTE